MGDTISVINAGEKSTGSASIVDVPVHCPPPGAVTAEARSVPKLRLSATRALDNLRVLCALSTTLTLYYPAVLSSCQRRRRVQPVRVQPQRPRPPHRRPHPAPSRARHPSRGPQPHAGPDRCHGGPAEGPRLAAIPVGGRQVSRSRPSSPRPCWGGCTWLGRMTLRCLLGRRHVPCEPTASAELQCGRVACAGRREVLSTR